MSNFTPIDFIRESNRIENINREPSEQEVLAYDTFIELKRIEIQDLQYFISLCQPGAILRDKIGLNVRVGNHFPPSGGMNVVYHLEALLNRANSLPSKVNKWHEAWSIHCDYEELHPFTDGNGRSGRMLWMWIMQEAPLGFLHTFYYQTLANLKENSHEA